MLKRRVRPPIRLSAYPLIRYPIRCQTPSGVPPDLRTGRVQTCPPQEERDSPSLPGVSGGVPLISLYGKRKRPHACVPHLPYKSPPPLLSSPHDTALLPARLEPPPTSIIRNPKQQTRRAQEKTKRVEFSGSIKPLPMATEKGAWRLADGGQDAPPTRNPYRPSFSTAMNASCGISTCPTIRILFFPAFCFSSSFRFRVTSPP